MSKWQAEGNIIRSDGGTHIAEAADCDTARQIVLEHNAHGELVELAMEYRANRLEMHRMASGWPELQKGKYQVEIGRIDVALKLAEGKP